MKNNINNTTKSGLKDHVTSASSQGTTCKGNYVQKPH